MDIAMIRRAGKTPQKPQKQELSNATIRDLKPTMRAFKAIEKLMGRPERSIVWGTRITALCKYSADDFLGLKNCGNSTVNEIRSKLKPFGLFLKNDQFPSEGKDGFR